MSIIVLAGAAALYVVTPISESQADTCPRIELVAGSGTPEGRRMRQIYLLLPTAIISQPGVADLLDSQQVLITRLAYQLAGADQQLVTLLVIAAGIAAVRRWRAGSAGR